MAKYHKENIWTLVFAPALDQDIQDLEKDPAFEGVKEQLRNNPYVGRALGPDYFREKRIGKGKKRLYYLIYEEHVLVLLAGVSGKKNQQATINAIKAELPNYMKFAKEAIKKNF